MLRVCKYSHLVPEDQISCSEGGHPMAVSMSCSVPDCSYMTKPLDMKFAQVTVDVMCLPGRDFNGHPGI